MLGLLLLGVAAAGPTRLLEDDEAARAWIHQHDEVSRAVLPVVGPRPIERLQGRGVPGLRWVVAPPTRPYEEVAVDARLTYGSPCALVLTPTDGGSWAVWTSGVCGGLGVGGWRYEGGRVLDTTNSPILVPQFAQAHGDRDVLRTYRRLERTRSRAIWMGIVGTGVLISASVGFGEENTTAARALQVAGGLTTVAAGAQLVWVQSKPHSHPQRLDAHYPTEVIEQRVREHNRRLQLEWYGLGAAGVF